MPDPDDETLTPQWIALLVAIAVLFFTLRACGLIDL